MTRHFRGRLVATTILVALSAPAFAFAQTAATAAAVATDQLEEVVVTAQHVTENIQRAAISATVSTGENLVVRGINDTTGLARLVPGIQITPNNGYVNYNIRGITSGGLNSFSDTAIAVNYNQVSLAFPSGASGLYYDLERVELLNGPQGILYGRNATAGAVNVVAKKPDLGGAIGGNVGVDYGNYHQINGRFALNVPVSEKVALRLAGQTVNHKGYYSDGSSDQHDRAVRLSLLAEPSENLSLYLTADYAKTDSKGLGVTLAMLCGGSSQDPTFCYLGPSPRTGLENLQQFLLQPRPTNYNDSYFWGVTGTLEWNSRFGTLTVIPSYRRISAHTMANNANFGSLRQWDDPNQKSLEIRFQSPQDQRLKYQVGVYGLRAPMHGLGGGDTAAARTWSANFYEVMTKSYAAFGQLTFSLTDKIRLVGGARYTVDEKSTHSLRYTLNNTFGANPNLPTSPSALPPPTGPAGAQTATFAFDMRESRTWTSTTYKAGLEWDVTDHSFAYFDVRSGFKSGGFFFGPRGANTFDPETLTAYSVGSKNRFFGNKLQVNLEAFLYDYSNQQLGTNLQLANGQLIAVTENVGSSKIKGAEIAVDWLALENTRLGANVQWAEGNYGSLVTVSPTGRTGNNATSACNITQIQFAPLPTQFRFDCGGLGFVNLSRWSYNLDATQTLPLSNGAAFVAEVNLRYQSARNNSITFVAGSVTPASTLVDANLRYRAASGKWDLTAFANNLAKYRKANGVSATGSGGTTIYFVNLPAPRTYGVRANFYY